MKKHLLYITLVPFLLCTYSFSQYLQEGLYPDCSYIIVTDDGWKIHKNHEGRILSMQPSEKHSVKVGKYSFDKFGNLVPYVPCELSDKKTDSNKNGGDNGTDVDVNVKIDFSKLFSSPKFSVRGGATMPYGMNGVNISEYTFGYNYGVDVNFNKFSFSFLGMGVPHSDSNLQSLTSTGFFVNYNLNLGKLYFNPGAGLLSQEAFKGVGDAGEFVTGSDMAIRGEAGVNIGNFSIFTQGIYTPSSYFGIDGANAFYANFGIKYNF